MSTIKRREFLRHTAAMGIAAALPATADAVAAPNRPPNIVLVLVDDLGYGDLGCYGQKEIPTPNLDRMATEGMRFTQFYAGSSVCAPSRCALLTGMHTGHARIRGNGGGPSGNLQMGDLTIAEHLKKAGYDTAHFGKWGLGAAGSDGVPTRKGFDTFLGYLDHNHAHNLFPTFLYRGDKNAGGGEHKISLPNIVPNEKPSGAGKATVQKVFSPDLFIKEALDYLDARKQAPDRPFFLYFAPPIPHANSSANRMDCPDDALLRQFAGKSWPPVQKQYAALVSRLDRDMGRLLDKLKANHMDDNTLVVFLSDNGPHREGGCDPQFFHSSGPLKGIKRDLYEGGIRIPALARWPARIHAKTVSDHVAYFPDVFSTLLEIGGTTATSPAKTDGLSFVPALLDKNGQQKKQHDFLYWEFYERGGAQAARMKDWKGVCQPWDAPMQLYDLSRDQGESTDLAGQNPDIVREIRLVLNREHVASPFWKIAPPAVEQRSAVKTQ